MNSQEDEVQEVIVPELPPFDRRRTRRAVWRGILRTAFTVLVGFLVLSMVWQVIGAVWFGRHKEHFEAVAGQGFLVAHPGYRASGISCCNGGAGLDGELRLDLTPRGPGGERATVTLTIRNDWLGHIDQLPDAIVNNRTAVDEALSLGPPDGTATTKLLDQLPVPMTASAIVEFATPMDQAGFNDWAGGHLPETLEFHTAAFFMSPVYPAHRPSPAQLDRPLAWPVPDVAGFQDWARQLEASDDANLTKVQLPSARAIDQVADQGRIHGIVLETAAIGDLRALLADRTVASVRVADVAFDLSQQTD